MQYLGGKSKIANAVAGLINAIPRRKKSDSAGDSGTPVKSAGGGGVYQLVLRLVRYRVESPGI